MSNSTFAENYLRNKNEKGFSGGSECIFIGGASVTQYTKKQLDAVIGSLVDATSKLTEGTKQSVASANKSIKGTISTLKKINPSKLSSNEFIADKYSATLVGGVQSNDVFDSDYFTGDNVVDSINYLVDSAMFVGGTSIELTNDLKNTMIMLSIYLSLLNEITKSLDSKSKKLNVETMDLLQRQKQAIMKLLELYNNLKRDMHTDSDDYSTVMKKLYKEGDISKLKERISQTGNKKELLKLLELAAKLERPTLYYSDKLKKAIDDIGGSMAEFEKVKTTPQLEELINKYLLESKRSGNAKKLKKFKKSIETVRSLMEQKIYGQGESLEVEMEASNEMEGSSEPLYTPIVSLVGAGEIESLFDGGEFEELNKEVKLQLSLTDTLTGLSPEKKMFIEENNKLISDMLISAKDAAFEFHKLQKYDDVEILGFLRRLYVLNNIDTDRMDVFYQRGRNYSSNYIRDEFIFGLKDLVLAAKKIENKVPKIKDFYNNVEKYISFLEKWIKITDQQTANLNRFSGGVSCSGVSGSDIYERFESEGDLFYGGIVGMQFSDIIDVFSKSIMVGRMQNGLNLTIDEVKKFSDEQEKVNEKIIGKQINEYLLMMQKYYDNYKEEETFPINKGLFGSVLRDNLNGVKQLLHAAQALDKKIRTYHLKVIENPQAAKDLVQMLSKVVIDLNWITDPDFTELKEFNKYFHIESVAKNKNKYGTETLQKGQLNNVTVDSDMTIELVGNVTSYNTYKNDYIKEKKDSPFPAYFKDCLMTHVSTLITAMKEPKSDIEEINKLKNDNFKQNNNVNYYFGKSVFPAKHLNFNDVIANGNNIPKFDNDETNTSVGVVANGLVNNPNLVPIASAIAIPQTIKFLDKNVIGSFYREAQTNLRKGVDSVLMLRNLFSVFDQIDKSYAKDSGSGKTGEKVGKIYASVKEYLILSAMYPTIYSSDDGKYMAGHIAMRKFGHEIVCPINESDVKFRSTELLGDLQINSLREYSKGYVGNKAWTVGNDNKPFPGFNDNVEPNVDAGLKPDTNYEIRSKCEFVNMFTKCDQLLVMMMKSMFTKIMSIMSMYNVVNFQTNAAGQLVNTLPYHQLRTIYGGIDNFFNTTPDVIPENSELYIRVFYYMIFYKELFFEESRDNNLIHIVAGARRFALLPINEGKFTGLMKLFFLKWFEVRFTNDEQKLSDVDISTFVNECNGLAKSVSGTPKSKAEKIVSELVKDINHRYGLVFTDDIRKLMTNDRKFAYPQLNKLDERTRTDDDKKFKTNVIRRTSTILDGENEGLADAASKSKEYGQTILGQATILSANDAENYNLNEHLAAVYNFRKKLDLLTTDLDAKFQSMMNNANVAANVGNSELSGLFRYIMILRYKLETQKNPVDRYRIFKEYLLTKNNSLVYKVSQESLMFKELVITPCNLLFKIYVRVIGSINIYGRDQIFVDPLLRGTFLYYLDSVNTNLVDVGSTGSAPVLDFSRLEEMCNQYLEQTRMYFLQLRSGVVVQYANEMEKVINFLINTHRSLFSESGLITKIEYDAHMIPNPLGGVDIEDPGIKLNPLIDYSEYIHAAYINGAGAGSNSFVLDQAIFEYPDLREGVPMLTDPRSFITKDPNLQNIKDIQFELLSKGFSPKNIYMLFEYLLFVMYKMFFEKYGKIYTPVLEAFVSALEGLNIGEFNILDFSDELGGNRQSFSADLPFSNKMAAVYKTLYKYTDRKDGLTEPDITKISKEQVETMRRNIPLFMFLFKFIVKQSFIQLNMMTNDNSYNKVARPITADLPAAAGADALFANFSNRQGELTPIIGGEDPEVSFAKIKSNYNSINEGNNTSYSIVKDLGKKLSDLIKLNPVGKYDYDNIKETKMVQTLYPYQLDSNFIDSNKRGTLVTGVQDYIKKLKQIKDSSNYKTAKGKQYFDDLKKSTNDIINNIDLVKELPNVDGNNYSNIVNGVISSNVFELIKTPVRKFINDFITEFGDLTPLFNNDISDIEDIRKRRMGTKTGKNKGYSIDSYLEILDLPKSIQCNINSHSFEFDSDYVINFTGLSLIDRLGKTFINEYNKYLNNESEKYANADIVKNPAALAVKATTKKDAISAISKALGKGAGTVEYNRILNFYKNDATLINSATTFANNEVANLNPVYDNNQYDNIIKLYANKKVKVNIYNKNAGTLQNYKEHINNQTIPNMINGITSIKQNVNKSNYRFYYSQLMMDTANSYTPFAPNSKDYLGMDEIIYEQTFTNIIGMLESFPTAYIPANTNMDESGMHYEGLFADAINNYQYYKSVPTNNMEFEEFFEKFIEEKVNLFFMKDHLKFFSWYFTFIDTRPISADSKYSILQLVNSTNGNKTAGVVNNMDLTDDDNITKNVLDAVWNGASIANADIKRNNKIALFPVTNNFDIRNDHQNVIVDLPFKDPRNITRKFINMNEFGGSADNTYNPDFYFDKMDCISKEIFFTRMVMGIADPSYNKSKLVATNFDYQQHTFVVPTDYPTTVGYGTVNYDTSNIKKYLLNQKYITGKGGLLSDTNVVNRVFKQYKDEDYKTVDKLYYHLRDIAMFILNTKAKSQSEAYNKVKSAVLSTLKDHYIKKNKYLPILKPYFIPTLVSHGITLPYNKLGKSIPPREAPLLGFSYYTLSNVWQFSVPSANAVDYTAQEISLLMEKPIPRNLGYILDKNFGRNNNTLLENILPSCNRYLESVSRNYEYVSSLALFLNSKGFYNQAADANLDTNSKQIIEKIFDVQQLKVLTNNENPELVNIANDLNTVRTNINLVNYFNIAPIIKFDEANNLFYSSMHIGNDHISPFAYNNTYEKCLYDTLISSTLDLIPHYDNNFLKFLICAASNIKTLIIFNHFIRNIRININLKIIDNVELIAIADMSLNHYKNISAAAAGKTDIENITKYYKNFYNSIYSTYDSHRNIVDNFINRNKLGQKNLIRECFSYNVIKSLNINYNLNNYTDTVNGVTIYDNIINYLIADGLVGIDNINDNTPITNSFVNVVSDPIHNIKNIYKSPINKLLIDNIKNNVQVENFSQGLNLVSRLYSGSFLTNLYFYDFIKETTYVGLQLDYSNVLYNSLNYNVITSNYELANTILLNNQNNDPTAAVNYEKLAIYKSQPIKDFKKEFSNYLYKLRSSIKKITYANKIIGKQDSSLLIGSMPEFKKDLTPLPGTIRANMSILTKNVIITEVNIPNIIDPNNNPVPNPTGSNLCQNCGSMCEEANITARAKNAIKFGTLIYRSLSTTFTEFGSIPKYLETNPYLTEMQSLISLEETLKPTSIAIDLIPGIINTELVDYTSNIVKDINKLTDRKGLGLHCNNIKELDELLMGSKNNLLAGLMLFLTDDKMHKITLNDFPWLKQLTSGLENSDILSGIDSSKLSTFIQNFGTLSKYLYELEMKHNFANMFPLFNSLDVPKFKIRGTLNANNAFDLGGGDKVVKLYGTDLTVQNSTKISLPFVLQYTSLKGKDANVEYETYKDIIRYYCGDITTPATGIHPLLEDHVIPVNELVPLIEMNTNVSVIEKYLTEDGKLLSFNNTNYKSRQIINQDNMIRNILDIGIFPINIHAMMRELPLANTINNNYSFDVIMKWLGAKDRRELIGTLDMDNTKKQYVNSYLLNPMNQQFVPIHDDTVFGVDLINPTFVSRLNLKNKANSKHIETLVAFEKALGGNVMCSDNANLNYNYSYPADIGNNRSPAFEKYRMAAGPIIQNDDNVIVDNINVGTTNRNASIPFQYYPIAWFNNVDGHLTRGTLYNPDLGLLKFNGNSKLVEKLSGNSLDAAGVINNTSTSYYGSQTMYNRDPSDAHNGVDKDLANPILSVNIYAEVLYNTYRNNVKKFFEEQPNRYNESVIQEGATTLFMPSLVESNTQ